MRFSYQSLLLGAATLASAQFTPPADDCDNEMFGASKESGAAWNVKDGSTYFCDTRWKNGDIICGVETWSYKYHQAGVRFKYSNGEWGPLHGRRMREDEKDNWTDYKTNRLEWDCATPVTEVRSWGNWKGFSDIKGVSDAVGGIRINVEGKELKITTDVGDYAGDTVEIFSGYIAAVRGRSGGYLDTLEWKFLASPVKSAKIVDMKFNKDLETVNKEKEGIRNIDLADVWFVNPDEVGNKTYLFSNAVLKDVTTTITHGTDHAFGVKVGVKVSGEVGVPLLAKSEMEVSTEASYQMTKTNTESTATKDSVTLTYNEQGPLPPKSATHCKAWSFTGSYEDDYTAVVQLTFENGKTVDVNQGGHFQSIGWTSAVSVCDDRSIEEAPTDAVIPDGDAKKVRAIGFRA